MSRVYNFSAGPAVLPEEVLNIAANELTEYKTTGQSVMEMSHRSKEYGAIISECEGLLREVMSIPDNYKVLFLQGGASSQFAMIPLNLMNKSKKADFVITGQWAKKAYQEAQRYGECKVIASSADKTFSYIPQLDETSFTKDADYFHICMNNTIYGSRFVDLPETGSVPLVADMSSCILSEPYDVSKFGIIYAGAQKNMGPAGLTVVIIREDLIGNAQDITPTMFNYKTHAENDSMYNTPPTYGIYILKLVLEWVKNKGRITSYNVCYTKLLRLMSPTLGNHIKTSVCSYKDNLVYCFTSNSEDTDIQKRFFTTFVKMGAEVTISTNECTDDSEDKDGEKYESLQ